MLGAGLILFLAVLQGASELFPVSSLGHAVVVPALLHLRFDANSPAFVPVLTVLHLGTAAALLVLYRLQWWRIVTALLRSVWRGELVDADARLGAMLVVGTIPAGLVGVIFKDQLTTLFGNPRAAASFLIANAAILLGAEWFRRRDERRRADPRYLRVEGLSLRAAVVVGFSQALALLPGISRSGVTMAAGLMAGLRHQEAARFSFLLATPVILGAGLVEVPDLGPYRPTAVIAVGAAVLAGVVAYLSARFLLRYLRVGRLDPFAYYCAALGALTLAVAR